MDKNAIKKYAIWAREELIKRVSARAEKYGISNNNMVEGTADTVNGILLTSDEKKQRTKLIGEIKSKGYEQIMEEVAYTWFNRFCALRFMEVNNYLPTHIRVFTDESNKFEPQIMAEAIHLELDGLDKSKVLDLKEKNANDELYKYLLITQCNALSSILPGMFQKISDFTELLFPDNILRDGSVIEQMITLIAEEDWQDAVQIIGWLYQYYNSVPKDMVFANLKKNIKIKKEDIPAATQLFTPDWIVRYMVENSLGRLWYEGHPDEALKSNWKYYLDEAEQETEVQAQLEKIREEYKLLKPEDIKCIDPCMGSGHILVYMFDVLMQIYESYGYSARDAAASIVEKNLYGLDIDDRAAQLAYFGVMMKASQYDRRFFSRDIQPHIYAIPDYEDWKEYGSLTIVNEMPQRPKMDNAQMSLSDLNNDFLNIVVDVAEVLTGKYDIVVTNPPYMGSSGMGTKLSDFVKKNYPDSKSDLFAVFMERCGQLTSRNCYQAMITQHAWMFLSSFEKLRAKMLLTDTINMAHLGARAFEEIGGEVVQTTTWVQRNSNLKDYKGTYCRLVEPTTQQGKEDMFLAGENRFAAVKENFSKIPGSPIAYWVSEKLLNVFHNGNSLRQIAEPKQGLSSANNELFLRLWFEVNYNGISFESFTPELAVASKKRWFPHTKGGSIRKWYGNNEYIVNWENDGYAIRHYPGSAARNTQYYFREGLTWSTLASHIISFRYTLAGFTMNTKGSICYLRDSSLIYNILGILNSKTTMLVLSLLAPTLDYSQGPVGNVPIPDLSLRKNTIDTIVLSCIKHSHTDWDSFETSWDFKKHPLLQCATIQSAFKAWEQECTTRFTQLKQNEEELNRIFIDIYSLQDELTPGVEDKDVTVRLADKTRDIKSFLSYAVGCMFGRYSLDVEGLAYAGGDWDNSKYATYPADKDNIIPICDDEYFDDDIVGRFVSFVETVHGAETLDENLKFIADALGGKGQPKDVIRNYFLNDFFADHCKIYQKRPIYWLFDSGKKNGFKALIYMHRYEPDTLARMRTDYVHEQQGRYRTALNDLELRINDATTAERVKLTKQLTKIKDQDSELHIYEEKIHHLADQMIAIDLDDGVKHNYALFQDVLAKIK